MNFYPLTKQADIEQAFKKLHSLVIVGEKVQRSLNFFRNGGPTEIYWHAKERIWFNLGEYENRWAIACGNDDPYIHLDKLEIICTFNVPFKGINRRCAGVFLQEDKSKVHLGHNGSFPKFYRSVAAKELSG